MGYWRLLIISLATLAWANTTWTASLMLPNIGSESAEQSRVSQPGTQDDNASDAALNLTSCENGRHHPARSGDPTRNDSHCTMALCCYSMLENAPVNITGVPPLASQERRRLESDSMSGRTLKPLLRPPIA